jgi:hypothetical protein
MIDKIIYKLGEFFKNLGHRLHLYLANKYHPFPKYNRRGVPIGEKEYIGNKKMLKKIGHRDDWYKYE